MKAGYTIENGNCSDYAEQILVYNYQILNTITNLPCVAETVLLKERSCDLLGVWKLKKLKN